MLSTLFKQTIAGAVFTGLLMGFCFSWHLFLPGCALGAICVLLTCGIRDPEPTLLDVLKKEPDTNMFQAFVDDLLNRIEEYGNDGAAAALLLDGRDTNMRTDTGDPKVATLFIPVDTSMCSDDMMLTVKKMRKNTEVWKSFLLSHVVDTHVPPQDIAGRSSLMTINGKVILLDKLRDANVKMKHMEASNGAIYKIGVPLLPGRFIKDAKDLE